MNGPVNHRVQDSRHHFRLKGQAAEMVIQDMAARSYFTDWCYANPLLPDGKELCDLLVVFDNVVIIWQIKNLKLGPDGMLDVKEVEKNVRQLSGARRQMFDLKRPITLTNPRRGGEMFDPSTIQEVYLISVLAGENQAVNRLMDTAKSATVHVFNSRFAEIVLNELDTVSDFVQYLKAKETLFRRLERLILVGGEEELLAGYLRNGHTFDHFAEFTAAVIEDGLWDHIQGLPEWKARKQADEVSYGWDDMIERIHTGASPKYERLAREMARLSRFKRRCLSKCFLDAHIKAHKDLVHDVFRRVVPDPDDGRTYCFLFMDDPEPRDSRKASLEALCYVARRTYKQNQMVIGIATEKLLRPTCTYDFCLIEAPEWTDEDDRRAAEIQRKTGILTNMTTSRGREDEYPRDTDPPR